MPLEATPRISLGRSTMPFLGMVEPDGANTTLMPARALGAPHTTWIVSDPVSTWQSLSLSAFGCGSAETT